MSETSVINERYNMPVIALRGMTLFPNALFHFDIGRVKTIKALEQAMTDKQMVCLVTQREITCEDPQYKDLYHVGTLAKVRQVLRLSNDNVRVLVEGINRIELHSLVFTTPYLLGEVSNVPQISQNVVTKRDEALVRNAQELFFEYCDIASKRSGDITMNIMETNDMSYLADYIAQNTPLKFEDKQAILETIDPRRRVTKLVRILAREVDILALEIDIQTRVKDQMDKNQRDYYLREQAKIICEELGEAEDSVSESAAYVEKIAALKLDGDIHSKLTKEAQRLAKMQTSSPESALIRTYLDICLELPWNKYETENDDISKAAAVLERDHYGMEKVKERILELFAVRQLNRDGMKGQIICLVGPPGVGKTSIARSVAEAMGRSFARLSLGGVRDEADIRGHRKTYIGAMPGRIMNAVRQAGTKNCLILIDEIDKLGSDYKGDPSSALLEVLDTEQNTAFRDHFVELPFDLSDVLFITTANNAGTIPAPLLDRMELIELGSYTDEEKVEIVRRHLLPKQMKKHGLKASNMPVSDDIIRDIISMYTRESGVRTLERELSRLCRKAAKYIVDTGKKTVRITTDNLTSYLGTPRFKKEKTLRPAECGVVSGLAWTSVGGEMLEVEVLSMEGTGKTELTGNLGDVMKESVKAAISFIRSRSAHLGISSDYFSKHDLHLHFPEGAVPKDGPSAGITVATAIISAVTGREVPSDLAMTGEISLRGKVMAIGGLKEKSMAALRAGIHNVIIPVDNVPDLDDIDQIVRSKLTFTPVSHMDEIISMIFPASVELKETAAPVIMHTGEKVKSPTGIRQ